MQRFEILVFSRCGIELDSLCDRLDFGQWLSASKKNMCKESSQWSRVQWLLWTPLVFVSENFHLEWVVFQTSAPGAGGASSQGCWWWVARGGCQIQLRLWGVCTGTVCCSCSTRTCQEFFFKSRTTPWEYLTYRCHSFFRRGAPLSSGSPPFVRQMPSVNWWCYDLNALCKTGFQLHVLFNQDSSNSHGHRGLWSYFCKHVLWWNQWHDITKLLAHRAKAKWNLEVLKLHNQPTCLSLPLSSSQISWGLKASGNPSAPSLLPSHQLNCRETVDR